ncbi:Pr6Pr family membrane protein [Pelagibacterium xiamenense]|uniref:Pr6Pr family membrane protein n=1 Tax=Pelagibacterium xiamenense TaxID=2901140 RepID=UPI001E516746|nr:Pr6Pr family membrane protein [Pelagibacterium xiamenense]MCD7060581.1 Pr6Pr family membrane protein [Pelagibacterium xiamenense]
MRLDRILACFGFVVGCFTLASQFTLTVSAYMNDGKGWPLGILHYLGFLTILSNTGLVLTYASTLFPHNWLEIFRHPKSRGAVAAIITLVMIFYNFLLAPINPATGFPLFNDYIFHYLLPVVYLVWWFIGTPHGTLEYKDVPVLVAPGLVYAAYVLVRGPILNEYPYPMIDVNAHGYPQVLLFMLYTAIGLCILAALVVLADRLLAGRRQVAAS